MQEEERTFSHERKSESCRKKHTFVHLNFSVLSWPENKNIYPNLEATVTLTAVWKPGVSKRGILKSPVLYFLGWIKLIFDTADLCNFVIN